MDNPSFGPFSMPALAVVGLRWPALAIVGQHWPLLVSVGHCWSALAVIGLHCSELALVVVVSKRYEQRHQQNKGH